MAIKEFSREYLMNDLDLPWSAVEDEIIGNGRWTMGHRIVFRDVDGKFYQTHYSVGATEYQDERPWEYEKIVKCVEVRQKKVLVPKWVPVEEAQEG